MLMGEEPRSFRSLSPTFEDLMDEDFEDILELAAVGSESPVYQHYSGDRHNSVNAVHMEVQENAKIPTFNFNVDRSNSSDLSRSQQPCSPTTRQEIEEMMRLSEQDFNLTEVFLKSNDRSSKSANYIASGGSMRATTNAAVGDRLGVSSKGDSATSISTKKANTVMEAAKSDTSNIPASVTNVMTSISASAPSKTPNMTIIHQPYYSRPHQLPIPSASAPPPAPVSIPAPGESPMRDALATAAALVSQDPSPDTQKLAESVPHAATPSPVTSPAPANANAPQPSILSRHPPLYSYAARSTVPAANPYPYSLLNASAAAPTPQMTDATKRRSQFGFGGNHQVPCVPPLPPKSKKSKGTSKKSAAAAAAAAAIVSALPPSANSGPAYERKKQRAKDSRVKLNDSIEKLAVSISLAGTQSHRRVKSLRAQDSEALRKVMQDCADTADSAKKWDRPAFVATAAALIQGLNAQCEALMRELILHTQCNADCGTAVPTTMTNGIKRVVSTVGQTSGADQDDGGHDTKRPRLASICSHGNMWKEVKVLKRIASFLDAHSLLRGQQVNKQFRSILSEDSLWLDLCVKRFGQYHVRQWQEKLNDEDEDDIDNNGTDDVPKQCTKKPMMLYYKMNDENVKPFNWNLAVLGETRMPNKISAWVSMVERSNGETCRSVKTNGRYASLSVVEFRILIQNTGCASDSIVVLQDQLIVVDASTRRRGEEWKEITWDERFAKRILSPKTANDNDAQEVPKSEKAEVHLRLYESVVLVAHVHCKGCSTASKFKQRANFTKVLVRLNGATVPVVIPFFRDS